MRLLGGTRDGTDRDWVGNRLADVAGVLLDIDDWGFVLIIVGGLVLVVFVAVSLFGALRSGEV